MSISTSPKKQTNTSLYQGLNRVSFDFWGAPVIQNQDGTLSCPGYVGDTYAANDWDKVFIGVPFDASIGEQPYTPGVATIRVDTGVDYDIKKASGGHEARVTMHGKRPCMVDITITIWTPEQLKMLSRLWDTIFPAPNRQKKSLSKKVTTEVPFSIPPSLQQNPTPGVPASLAPSTSGTEKITKTVETTVTSLEWPSFDVYHPLLTRHRVKSVIFAGGSGPDPAGTPGVKVFTIRAIQFSTVSPNVKATSTPVQANDSVFNVTAYPTPGTVSANLGPNT